ncbi:hypothetical protein GCM10009557_05590 [Virgisporangium ochraceum]|uniref:Uncharacterized protein n=1 Tax=Virgisporangium ochraceum TaxID=65505 RepID=A0A8J3ZT22_9ACTN|nr:hypothetical protein [Virgisporangium ochraceum]GIJ69964.1 hypothetical protein Voc01_048810 [Virgisporangium ochraceum]
MSTSQTIDDGPQLGERGRQVDQGGLVAGRERDAEPDLGQLAASGVGDPGQFAGGDWYAGRTKSHHGDRRGSVLAEGASGAQGAPLGVAAHRVPSR